MELFYLSERKGFGIAKFFDLRLSIFFSVVHVVFDWCLQYGIYRKEVLNNGTSE